MSTVLVIYKNTGGQVIYKNTGGHLNKLSEETMITHGTTVTGGVCNGIGENHLGKILMKIHDELQTEA